MQRSNKISDVYAESSMSFPQKLYALMSREDGSVVKWASHGFAFIVCNQDKFVDEIIPKYFKRKFKLPVYAITLKSDLIYVYSQNRHETHKLSKTVESVWISQAC